MRKTKSTLITGQLRAAVSESVSSEKSNFIYCEMFGPQSAVTLLAFILKSRRPAKNLFQRSYCQKILNVTVFMDGYIT